MKCIFKMNAKESSKKSPGANDVHLINRAIKKLFIRSQQCPETVMIEGTVDTGFEKTSLEELLHKFPEIGNRDYCVSAGRLYFNINREKLIQVNI